MSRGVFLFNISKRGNPRVGRRARSALFVLLSTELTFPLSVETEREINGHSQALSVRQFLVKTSIQLLQRWARVGHDRASESNRVLQWSVVRRGALWRGRCTCPEPSVG